MKVTDTNTDLQFAYFYNNDKEVLSLSFFRSYLLLEHMKNTLFISSPDWVTLRSYRLKYFDIVFLLFLLFLMFQLS